MAWTLRRLVISAFVTAHLGAVTVWIVPTGSDTLETLTAAKPDRMLTGLGELLVLLA